MGLLTKFCCILLLNAVSVTAQVVQGTVVDSVTGNGLAGVKVQLYWSGDLAYSATSDARGRFLFDHVQNGVYMAQFNAPGYQYEDMFRSIGSEQVRVTAGGNPVELVAHMMPMGRLSGRVVDGKGGAVAKAVVQVSGPGMRLNFPTDAKGKFEVHEFVFPGAYTLSVTPPPELKPPEPEAEGGRVLGWARTWYPGVTMPEAAGKVPLVAGGEVADLELKLQTLPAHAIRGVIVNVDGKPAPKVEVTLEQDFQPVQRVESKADGSFEFPAVVDGEWRLSAQVESGGVKLRASRWVEMAEKDREGVKLQLNAPFAVRGQVVVEAPKGLPAPRYTSYVVVSTAYRGREARAQRANAVRGRPEADGTFSLTPVYPDTYRIGAMPPDGYYLDAIRLGGAELATPEMELTSGAPLVTVIFKTNGGAVRGTVENCGSGGVVVVPQDAMFRDSARPARCDPNGRYEIAALRPGEYYVLALAPEGLVDLLES